MTTDSLPCIGGNVRRISQSWGMSLKRAQGEGEGEENAYFPLVFFANWESVVSSQRRGRKLRQPVQLGLPFFLGAGRPIIWRTSPMDKGRTEPCGRVTSKTHVSNTGAILNPGEIWVGVDFPEDSWKQASWSRDAKASHCGRMIEYEPAKVRSLFF